MNVIQVSCALIIILIVIAVWRISKTASHIHESFSENVVTNLPNIKKYQQMIESYIEQDLAHATNGNPALHRMCQYAVSGGKKIRSIILLSVYDHCASVVLTPSASPTPLNIHNAAIAVEYLHAASLILDDIADKDDYRRGRVSVHRLFGIGKAQLCALYLIGHAGKLLQSTAKSTGNQDVEIFVYDNIFSNLRKLIAGQYMDVSGIANDTRKIGNIEKVIHKKTGTMFEIPFIMGWTFANIFVPDETQLSKLKLLSRMFGQIFQVVDDFEDIEKDEKSHAKYNYVLNHGKARASQYLKECIHKFNELADAMSIYTEEIKEAISYLYKKVESLTI